MTNIDLYYQVKVSEPSGLLVLDTGLRPAQSFTIGFSKLLLNVGFQLALFAPQSVTNLAGSSVTTSDKMGLRTNAGTTTTTYGILVGTSTAAEAVTDTALGAQIAHGTSAGQLQYGAVTYGNPSTTSTTTTFRHTRVFTNGSGGTVTVQEIGLASQQVSGATSGFLLIRDLTGAVAVNTGQQLTVNYDLTTTI